MSDNNNTVPGDRHHSYFQNEQYATRLNFEAKPSSEKHILVTEESIDDQESQPARGIDFGAVLFDLLVAVTPLYFIIFAALGYNPTIFPIVFTTIAVKFIKALANWKLERGTTVGTIQHLLGSRSLVSSVTTPVKLRTRNWVVPLLVLLWVLNPIGGQTSLRVVSQGSKYTDIQTPFHYLDIRQSPYLSGPQGNDYKTYVTAATNAFSSALFSPASSKYGSQDMFGNLQIPMLEALEETQQPDSEGWYNTTLAGSSNGALHSSALDITQFQPIYISITGLPYLGNISSISGSNDNSTNSTIWDSIKDKLSANVQDIVNVQSFFSMETMYMFANCSLDHITAKATQSITWDTASVVSSQQGYQIDSGKNLYSGSGSRNETTPRRVGLQSGYQGHITEARCDLTTTYIEIGVYCQSGNICSVQRIRESTLPHLNPALTPLDGIVYNAKGNGTINKAYARFTAMDFFTNLIQGVGFMEIPKGAMSPVEYYTIDPAAPYQGTKNKGPGRVEVDAFGPTILSQRFSQMLNTFWFDNVAPFSVTGNFSFPASDGRAAMTQGIRRVQQTVLKCHIPYMVALIVISAALFAFGLITAYLDATRRGPDVFDDFVNSLRHNPYVHVQQGSTMEDGREKARRLRNTVIQMGDVKPDDPVGYVAIATPNDFQRVERLQPRRHYA